MSYCELYNKVKDWLANGHPRDWILSTVENSTDMKITQSSTKDIMSLLSFLERKCSEEQAINEGYLKCEGDDCFSVMGGNG